MEARQQSRRKRNGRSMTDRLDRFRTHIQRKLEDDIERTGELASWCKRWPARADVYGYEQELLSKSVVELRAVLDYLSDFEKLEAEQ